ncbi:MAG: hypothetical protein V5804_06185 [Mucilaginibacter sp.]|uniref:hypothetical protein n=1 Tax=Mucilaginibacter sp. TaxID=1882438 RepID=UPI0034E4D253
MAEANGNELRTGRFMEATGIHCRPIYGTVRKGQKTALAEIYHEVILKAILLDSNGDTVFTR